MIIGGVNDENKFWVADVDENSVTPLAKVPAVTTDGQETPEMAMLKTAYNISYVHFGYPTEVAGKIIANQAEGATLSPEAKDMLRVFDV